MQTKHTEKQFDCLDSVYFHLKQENVSGNSIAIEVSNSDTNSNAMVLLTRSILSQ